MSILCNSLIIYLRLYFWEHTVQNCSCPSVVVFIYLSIHPSIHLSIIHLSFLLSVLPSIYPSIHPFVGLLFSICLIDPSTFLFFLVYVSLHVFVVYSIVFLISSLLPAMQTLWLRFGCSNLFGEVRPENLHEKIGEVRWEKNQWSLQIVKITTVENWGWVLQMLGEIFSLVRGRLGDLYHDCMLLSTVLDVN